MAADLFAVVEMRVLLCQARGIFWRSSIAGREGERYAVDLPSQDRDKRLDPALPRKGPGILWNAQTLLPSSLYGAHGALRGGQLRRRG